MIRVVVVDDDYRVAGIHAAYVDKVDGFTTIAQAHTGAEATTAVDRYRPDLLLLDLYLPDEHGLDLAARLRQEEHPPVDVIVITAAKDADSVHAAMQNGAMAYLLKPFSFPALRDKLVSYAQMRSRLSRSASLDQRGVDRAFGAHPWQVVHQGPGDDGGQQQQRDEDGRDDPRVLDPEDADHQRKH